MSNADSRAGMSSLIDIDPIRTESVKLAKKEEELASLIKNAPNPKKSGLNAHELFIGLDPLLVSSQITLPGSEKPTQVIFSTGTPVFAEGLIRTNKQLSFGNPDDTGRTYFYFGEGQDEGEILKIETGRENSSAPGRERLVHPKYPLDESGMGLVPYKSKATNPDLERAEYALTALMGKVRQLQKGPAKV